MPSECPAWRLIAKHPLKQNYELNTAQALRLKIVSVWGFDLIFNSKYSINVQLIKTAQSFRA